MNTRNFVSCIALLIIIFFPCGLLAQKENSLPGKLVVGTLDMPPYTMKTADGRWEGLGMDLWRAVVDELGMEFVVREHDGIGAIAAAIVNGEIDVLPVAAVSQAREISVDFTNHYHRSGLAIAVRAEKTGHSWLQVIDRLVSFQFLVVIGSLLLLWLIAGTFVWLFESRRNREMFGESAVRGLGHGIWWAAVTMTTVGYGDKAPKTLGGRIIAIIWMFASIILISSFTAAITTSLTISELSGKVRGSQDLPTVRVGSVAQSKAKSYLVDKGIAVFPFKNERDGLQAIVNAKIDAFVFDEAILKYLVRTRFPTRVQVLPETFDYYFVSMAVPPESPLRESLNRAMLKFMETDKWLNLVEKYLGSGS